MGETADQTRAEIVQLRSQMSDRVVDLRKAAERPLRIAQAAAIGAVGLVVVGGIVLVAVNARRRAERRSLAGRAKAVRKAAGKAMKDPGKAASDLAGAAGSRVERTTDELRARLLDELRREMEEQDLKEKRPAYQRAMGAALQAAAGAAVPIILKKLEERTQPPSPSRSA